MVRVSQFSRLRFHKFLESEGTQFWDLGKYPRIPERPDDVAHTVTEGDRLDTLAFKYYGDPVLWWVLAVANEFPNPQTDLNVGDVIRIPSPAFVKQELFKTAKGT